MSLRPPPFAAPVAVIMPTFNSAPYVERALESVLAQTVPVAEIIIIDDCSSDNTLEVVRRFARGRSSFKIIELDVNQGPSAARNVGIDAADTEWVALLDADDAWKPDRVEALLALAQEHKADFVADNQIFYDLVAGKEVPGGLQVDWSYQIIDAATLFSNNIIEKSPLIYGILKPMMRRAFLSDKGLRYDESLRSGEDFILYAEMIFNGAHAILTSQAFYIYSTRVGAISNAASPASRSAHRFDLMVEAQDELARRYKAKLTPNIVKAMRECRQRLHVIHLANVARNLRRKNVVGFGLYTLQRPNLMFLYARRMRGKLRSKIMKI